MKKVLYLLLLVSGVAFSQIQVIHFNAGWNASNDVNWVEDLSDCKIKWVDIATDTDTGEKYEIVVVPTIIILHESEEIKRFQADISFSMKATKDEVQEKVDEILMEGF
jgi:hypothetical protein